MNIELIRHLTIPNLKSEHVLHIGEENAVYWLNSYKASNFAKIFWTAPEFYGRGYDISRYTNATVTQYTPPPNYFFMTTQVKPDGLLSSGPDESYQTDGSFRYVFDTSKIKAVVVDYNPGKIEELKMFLESSKTILKLINPNILYVRSNLVPVVTEFAKEKGLESEFSFEAILNKSLDIRGNYTVGFEVFTKR